MSVLSTEQISARLAEIVRGPEDPPAGRFGGRGIVIGAGGPLLYTSAYVLIAVLRRTLGCRLPIEVWHFGASEMSPAMADLLGDLDVDLVDADPLIAAQGAQIADGWQLKAFALMGSRFAEVLLLDADQVPVRDPAAVFEWPLYASAGAVFWPDIVDLRHDNPVWSAVGLPQQQRASLDSGQLAVDKRRHWRALQIALFLNEEAETFYRLVYGDKDTFLLAWLLAGREPAVVAHRPFADDRALFQRDPGGAVLFQHRTNAKWVYSGTQIPVAGFVHEDACLAALETLRARWGGRVFWPPANGRDAKAHEAALSGAALEVEIVAEDSFELVLLPHGEIGRGRAFDRRNWRIAERDGIALEIVDGERVTYRLQPVAPGQWRGVRLRVPHSEILASVSTASRAPAPDSRLVDDVLRAAGFPGDPGADAAIATALSLLDRATAGVAARVAALIAAANRTGDAAAAARLERIAAHIGRMRPVPPNPVVQARDVLVFGYTRPGGPVE